MSYIRNRSHDAWDRAGEIADGDLDRARLLHDALYEAYRVVAQLSFDCVDWPVEGYDRKSTLSLLAEMMGPKDVSAAIYADWQQAAYDRLQAGELG